MGLFVTWLGQGGFLLESEGSRLVIDPYFSNIVEEREGLKRLVAPPLLIKDLCPDLLFITHNHMDHFDPIALPEIHLHFPKAIIAGPLSVISKAMEMNFNPDVLIQIDKNQDFNFGPFKITATPAYHSDPHTVGLLIETSEKNIYLSSDSLYKEALCGEIKQLSGKAIDMVIVCINGKLGNMNWQEAVKLTNELAPQIAIPMHYGMFAENTENPNLYIESCKKLNINSFELIHGEKTIIK
jgi:L-ascorbate metabolism protein UlaG (beta-lactamase superfamily)